MDEQNSQSPLPPTGKKVVIEMSFSDALYAVVAGKRVTRLEWDNTNEYGILDGTYLKIHRGGKLHNWIVSEGDILALDWVVTTGN